MEILKSTYSRIILKKGKTQSLERFHPWVFSGAIQKIEGPVNEGDVVEIFDNKGDYIATGHYQIGSITVRVLSFEQKEINEHFWQEKIADAIALRKKIGLWDKENTNMFRLVHGEGDYMPGLIVDLYDRLAVLQCHSIGYFPIRQLLAKHLLEASDGRIQAVYDKSKHTLPHKAELGAENSYLIGEKVEWKALENGMIFTVDPEGGQKTGFFVDQRENRQWVKHYAQGREVLNMFSYTGGFSIAALQGNALRVDSVDSSAPAIEALQKHVLLNFGSVVPHQSYAEDAFKFLQGKRDVYDMIILDPPAFAKHHRVLNKALQGYRNLNLKAMSQIRKGGILFTFSCSQVVSKDDFRRSIFSAAALAKRKARILQQLSQPADHPINIYHPEGEYLKGLVLEII